MKEFDSRCSSEKGFTLIELIAATALIALFGGIIYSVIAFGVSSYNKIQVENSLRDEADLVMSAIINELYTEMPDKVRQLGNGIQLIHDGVAKVDDISFNEGKLYIGGSDGGIDTRSEIDDASQIALVCDGYAAAEGGPMECTTGLIEIQLVLNQQDGNKTRQLSLQSKFGF